MGNLLAFSEQLDNASAWGANAVTVSPNVATAPNGSITADKIIEVASGGDNYHFIAAYHPNNAQVVDNADYTFSVHGKAAELSWLYLRFVDQVPAEHGVFFNLATGVTGTIVGTASPIITPVAHGFYRCSIAGNIGTGAGQVSWEIYITTADGLVHYITLGGGSGLYAWGAQLDDGAILGAYEKQPKILNMLLFSGGL